MYGSASASLRAALLGLLAFNVAATLTCLEDVEVAFLHQLSSRDLRDVIEFSISGSGIVADMNGSVSVDDMRCLPQARAEMLREALHELGYGEWKTPRVERTERTELSHVECTHGSHCHWNFTSVRLTPMTGR